ncbi:MAG: V-type ATP synthase subunit I [Candidatus Micrarchaeia archaeon]
MLKPASMARVRVIGARDCIGEVIRSLHNLGAVQVEDIGKSLREYEGVIEQAAPLERFAAISDALVKLRGLEGILGKHEPPSPKPLSFEEALEKAKRINADEKPFKLARKIEAARERENRLREEIAALKPLQGFEIDFSKLACPRVEVFAGTIPGPAFAALKGALDREVGGKCELVHRLFEGRESIVLVVGEEKSAAALKALAHAGFARIVVPEGMARPASYIAGLRNELHATMEERGRLEEEARALYENLWRELVPVREALEIEARRAEVAARFGKTENVFVVEGWVKESDLAAVQRAVEKAARGKALVERISARELPPTALANPGPIRNFEDLATFVSLPKSNEFDPTTVYAVMFPVLYGLMLGDAGYGALVLALGLAGYWRASGLLKRFSFVLIPAGLWSIVFGLAFGEALGFEWPSLMSRLENITLLLLITIVFGAVHLAVGFFLGFLKAWEHRNYRHAAAKLAWIALEAGGALLFYGVAYGGGSAALAAGGIVSALSITVILFGEGMYGAVEIPGLIGNTLSYARMAAVGLSSLALALVLNIFKPDLSQGPFVLLFAPIWVAGHALNLGLGIFEPFVQGSRLHYVEQFTKFLEGGGVAFAPFKCERKYTVEKRS